IQTMHQIEVLHRLSCRSLDQVIDSREEDAPPAARSQIPRNVAEVGVSHAAQLWKAPGSERPDERMKAVASLEFTLNLLRAHPALECDIDRRKNTAVHRKKVGHEKKTGPVPPELLADLRRVAMGYRAIRSKILRYLAEQQVEPRTAAGTGDSRFRV